VVVVDVVFNDAVDVGVRTIHVLVVGHCDGAICENILILKSTQKFNKCLKTNKKW
jgi:hypothetical protein